MALAQVEKLRALQESETATFGLAFIWECTGADAFSKLSRYETSIERSFYRALHELQRVQQARLGGTVPAPVAIDVDVSGLSDDFPLAVRSNSEG